MKKKMKRISVFLAVMVMALSMAPEVLAANMVQYADDISITKLDEPYVNCTPDTDITVSGHAYVSECYWWWDSDGNGASDEKNCSVFKNEGKYYLRIVLKAEDGYEFPYILTGVGRNAYNKYTGTLKVNGEEVTGTVSVKDNGTTLIFNWWKAPAKEDKYYQSGNSTVVTVNYPTITRQPQDAAIAKGGTAEFTVTAEHVKELHYQWYFRKDGWNDERVGEDSPVLTLDRYEEGYVYCVVYTSSDVSTTSEEAKLTLIPDNYKDDDVIVVTYAPAITKQPKPVSAAEGGSATFTVEASGTNPLSYQWWMEDDGVSTKIGTDSPTLTLKNLDPDWDNISFWCVVSNEQGKATSDKAQLTVLKKVQKPVFTDVAENAYYNKPVAWAVDRSITNGTSDTTFSPDNTCTRAQIITFLWRAAGSPEPDGSCPFTDVKAGSYYEKAVTWAAEQGMAGGDKFSPDAPCTRLMAVEFMWAQAGKANASAPAVFTDVKSDAVNWAVEKGVTNGTGATTFSPSSTCTRGQIVTFLWRAFGQ